MKRMRGTVALILTVALLMTGVDIPVYGAPEAEVTENITATEVSEDAVEETDVIEETQTEEMQIEETEQENAVGAETTIEVHNAAELMAALKGWDTNNKAIPKGQKVRIQMQTPSDNESYILTGEMLGNQDLMLKEGLDITLDLNGNGIYLSTNAKHYIMEIPKKTSLSIESGVGAVYIGVVNRGTLKLTDMEIVNAFGDALVNHAGAVAELEHTNLFTSSQNTVAIRNAGAMTIGTTSYLKTDNQSHAAIDNTGEMLINSAAIYADADAGTVSTCAIINRTEAANLNIRGAFIDTRGFGIYNDAGTVAISSYANDYSTRVGADKGAVLTVNGGTVVCYEDVDILGTIATTPFAGDNIYTGTTDGKFRMVGGAVKKLVYSTDSLPILLGGTVGDRNNTAATALEVWTGANQLESDISKYNYLTQENGTPISGTYMEGSQTKVAYAIVDGKVYQPEEIIPVAEGVSVNSEAELISAVAAGGDIYINTEISLTCNLVITKDTTIHVKQTLNQASAQGSITIEKDARLKLIGYEFAHDSSYEYVQSGASAITNYGDLELENMRIRARSADETVTDVKTITNYGTLTLHEGARVAIGVNNGIGIHNLGTLNDEYDGEKAYQSNIEIAAGKGIAALKNEGTCNISYATINGSSDDSITMCAGIDNSGVCTLQRPASVCGDANEVAVKNSGICIVNGAFIEGYQNDSTDDYIAVYNTGKFILNSGLVKGGENNTRRIAYGIVYTDENYPVLRGGTVRGTDIFYDEDEQDSPVRGAAVAKDNGDGTYSRGYFVRSDSINPVKVDSQNTDLILYGVPQIEMWHSAIHNYILMPRGEVMEGVEDAFRFKVNSSRGEFIHTIESSDESVAEITVSENEGVPTWTLTAKNVGYTTLKSTYEIVDGKKLEDFLRIEVTEDMATLSANDYTGSLLADHITVNAYSNANVSYELPYEFHLNTSDMEAATGTEYWDLYLRTFRVEEVVIENEEFNRYFTYEHVLETSESNEERIEIKNIVSSNGATTMLLADGVKSIKNVEVKGKIFNEASREEFEITLGTFDVNVRSYKPVVRANGGFTLNGAYATNAYYLYEDPDGQTVSGYPNRTEVVSVGDYVTAAVNGVEASKTVTLQSLSKGISTNEIIDNGLVITALAKKGKESITVQAVLDDYVGTYPVKIPVTVTGSYPKVALDKKTVTVSSKSSAQADIPLTLWSKDAESAGTVAKIEVVAAKGKTSGYSVKADEFQFGTAYWNNEQNRYETKTFYLQPKSTTNKSETVTLKVTYADTNEKSGKTHATTLKIKIKASDKYTMKQNGKASLCTNSGNSTYVYFKTTPEYYEGAKPTIVSLNGAEIPEEVAGATVERCNYGEYRVLVSTKDGTQFLGKKLKFGVAWVDDTGNVPQGSKVTAMTVDLYADTSILTTVSPCITIKPEKIYKEPAFVWERFYLANYVDRENSTYVEYKTPIKFKGTGADAWQMTPYDDGMFHITYDKKKIVATADYSIVGGTQYLIPLTFTNTNTNATQTIHLTLKVADVKKVVAKFDTNTVTLYKDAPYCVQYLTYTLKGSGVTTPALGAGLSEITKVEIDNPDKSPFEIYQVDKWDPKYNFASEGYVQTREYGITFKDKKYPAHVSASALNSVTVKITYGSADNPEYRTAKVKLKVKIK